MLVCSPLILHFLATVFVDVKLKFMFLPHVIKRFNYSPVLAQRKY